MNLLKLLRDEVAELYEKNMHYESLETQEEREAFLDALINAMPMTEMLEHLSMAMGKAMMS